MAIYRTFTRQTDYVVQYLSVARQYEHHTRVEVPKLKHAPVNLGRQLEDYLKDPDFEVHRRQYLAEQDAKKNGGGGGSSSSKPNFTKKKESFPEPAANNPFPSSNTSSSQADSKPQANKGPDPDLIDFFDSIEDNQQPMQVNPQPQPQPQQMGAVPFQAQPTGMPYQPNGFQPQQTGFASNSPYQQQQNTGAFMQQQQPQQLQPNFTGAGFGGFTAQQSFQPGSLAPIAQDTVSNFQTQQGLQPMQTGQPGGLQPMQTGQTTNPFRASMMMAQQTGLQAQPTQNSPALNRQSTNPFARSPSQNTSPFAPASNSPFQPQQPQPQQGQFTGTPPPMQPTPTGTNPFARNTMQVPGQDQRPQTAGAALAAQPTGSTNPFRQGAFVNHATGQGWQHNQQPIGGGIDQLGTTAVFPRPAQQTPWQQ